MALFSQLTGFIELISSFSLQDRIKSERKSSLKKFFIVFLLNTRVWFDNRFK